MVFLVFFADVVTVLCAVEEPEVLDFGARSTRIGKVFEAGIVIGCFASGVGTCAF